MADKRDSLYLTYAGDMARMQALHAYMASKHGGGAGWILDVIDAAEKAGIEQARDLSDAIRFAAEKAGVR